jgi:hypothetical protein
MNAIQASFDASVWRIQWVKDAELEYRVIAINNAGVGSPSNTVMAVL